MGLKRRFMIGKIKDPIIGIDIEKDDISVFNHPAQYLMISNVNRRR